MDLIKESFLWVGARYYFYFVVCSAQRAYRTGDREQQREVGGAVRGGGGVPGRMLS